MPIHFSADRWARVREVYRQWWAGELDRPLIHLTSYGNPSDQPEPSIPAQGFTAAYGLELPVESIIDRWDYDLTTQRYLGDGYPMHWPNFGPGVLAAILGAELHVTRETVWFKPEHPLELQELQFTFDPENAWYRRIADIMRAATERWGDTVQIGMTDIGGAVDVLSSFRPSEELLLDLYDDPETVKRLVEGPLHEYWWQVFHRLDAILRRGGTPGYSAWTPIFSEEPYYMLQCDFCYMIGPDMFDEFVKPELAASCKKLVNGFYHLDGPGELPHLDSLLTIPELKGVQWVPEAGEPKFEYCVEVCRKTLAAGKRFQTFTHRYPGGVSILDRLVDAVGTTKGIILVGGIGPGEENDAWDILKKYGAE